MRLWNRSLIITCTAFGKKIHGHLETKSFFENLLPEGEIKDLLEAHGKSSIKSVFGFLQEFGGDCAWAFRVLPEKVKINKTKIPRKELKLDVIYKYQRLILSKGSILYLL